MVNVYTTKVDHCDMESFSNKKKSYMYTPLSGRYFFPFGKIFHHQKPTAQILFREFF